MDILYGRNYNWNISFSFYVSIVKEKFIFYFLATLFLFGDKIFGYTANAIMYETNSGLIQLKSKFIKCITVFLYVVPFADWNYN